MTESHFHTLNPLTGSCTGVGHVEATATILDALECAAATWEMFAQRAADEAKREIARKRARILRTALSDIADGEGLRA